MKLWGFLFILCGCAVFADASDFTGSLTALGGVQGEKGSESASLFRARLVGEWQKQWSPTWTTSVEGLGASMGVGSPFSASSSDDGEKNLLDAEWRRSSDGGRDLNSLRLQKACVEFEKDRWQGSAGRTVMAWGEAHTVRPTCVFHAPRFLEAFGDPFVGSDGVDTSYAIGANTSLEGAVRVMRGGKVEYVARIENRGIGVSGTPLFAKREGEDGLGAELSATLKHFQWRLEGMGWHEKAQNGRRVELVTGIYGTFRNFPVGAEFVRDGSGRLLGPVAGEPGPASNYISMFMETPAIYRLRVSPTVVKPLQGGRWLVKPGMTCDVSKHWSVGLEGRKIIGSASGPLDATPTQVWLSTTVTF